jgi:carboxyl-terminal processing protease
MLSNLRDAHTRVFAPAEKFDWRRPRFISVGVSVREVDNAPVIFAVEPDSEAERQGLRVGDALTSVDGEDALTVFARRLRDHGNSSTIAAARARAMAKLFDGAIDSAVRVAWIDARGKERTAMLKRLWRERDPALRVRRLERGRIGFVEFDIFTQEAAVAFMRALDGRLRDARGLIIDLRNNGGGDAEAMIEIISALLPSGKSLGRFTNRHGRIQSEPHTRAAMLLSADYIKSFRAPVIVLASERTSSAAEIFIAALKEAGRATILGQNTCGCALGLRRRHTLPDGGELHISELDYHTARGTRLEGAGVAPDEKITLDPRDLRARRDRAVERAVELLMVERRGDR